MLKPKSPQNSFYGSYLYDRIVPQEHLLRKINAVVDFSFVTELVKDRYTPDFGRPAEDPEFMLKLCLLQYIYGDSDREAEENAKINLAYKYFLGLAVDEEPPDYSTISYFRAMRLGEDKFKQVFQNIVQQCIDKGLVTGKRQIIDSTHIVADMAINSLSGLVQLCRRNVLREVQKQNPKIAQKLGIDGLQITKQDRFTRMEDGLDKEINEATKLLDGLADELKLGSIKANVGIRKNIELLEKAVADRADEAKDRLVSPVDPDARMGKKQHKSWAGYKGHVVVEEDTEIITAVETTPGNVDDGTRLKALLDQQKAANAIVPEALSGDKAYDHGANLEYLDTRNITGYISLSSRLNHFGYDLFKVDNFEHDILTDTVKCPAGQVATHHLYATFHTDKLKRNGAAYHFTYQQCVDCHLRIRCFKGDIKKRGRSVVISYYEPYRREMTTRMESEAGVAAYHNRYKIEHKIADLVRYCNMRRCRYRGLEKAKIHTLLSATVSNIKRMARLLWNKPDSPPELAVVAC